MRWVKIALWVIVGVPASVIALFLAVALVDDLWVRPRYFAAHPYIAALREAAFDGRAYSDIQESQARAAAFLLEAIPVGSAAKDAIHTLAGKEIVCGQPIDVDERRLVVCGFEENPGLIYATEIRWYFELHLDGEDRLTGIRVQVGK